MPVQAKIVEEILAIVNDDVITKTEFDERFAKEVELRRGFYRDEKKLMEDMEKAKPELLDLMIDELLFIQAAVKRGIKVTDAEVQQYVEALKNQAGSEEAFQQMLASEGYTIESFRRDIKRRLLSQKLNEKEFGKELRVTDEEIMKYYEKHKDQFPASSDTVKLKHVLIKFKITDDDKKRALTKAENALKMCKGGANFEELASKLSDYAPKEPGGDMGFFVPGAGKYDLKIEQAAAELAVDEISDLIETPGGYSIIKVVDRQGNAIRARRIYIAILPSPEAEKAAEDKANAILKELKNGAKFVDLVKKYSDDDVSKENDGDWKEIAIDSMSPDLKAAFDSFEVGAISKPVKTPLGIHIFKIVGRSKLSDKEMEQLRQAISNEKLRKKLDEYTKKLKGKAYIKILRKELRKQNNA